MTPKYTVIDAETLIEAVRTNGWKLQPIYTSALRALADEDTNLEYAVSISGDFLHQLYLEVVIGDSQIIDPRDALVFELLKILTKKRSTTIFIESLNRDIQRRFELMPLQKRDVLTAISVWVKQSIIT
ncbi:MAG: hypothetical protein WCD18_21175 [Thermosynechococcaceae cyanobacterium]